MRRLTAVFLALSALAACNSSDAPPSASFVPGGRDKFEKAVERADKPVVVNKWASWCPPCRLEFPFFRDQAKKRKGEVVFIGVNSQDNRGDAEKFLKEEPVPYRHFEDPKLEIAAAFNGVPAFPTTAFYDSKGKLAFTHAGGYANEEDLAKDIDRYAR